MSEPDQLPLAGIDVAILVGGLGTRLRGVVNDVPKPLAPVLGRPFLFYQLDMLALRGARSVTLCCGYKAELVHQQIGTEWLGMPVRYSVENEPLGTGGALALARERLHSDPCLLLNGDSWCQPDFIALLEVAKSFNVTLTLVEMEDASRFGTVELAGKSVVRFIEKQPGSGLINAGVYCIRQALLRTLNPAPCSLERDVFPELVAEGQLAGINSSSPFLDIGIPEDYAAAGDFFRELVEYKEENQMR